MTERCALCGCRLAPDTRHVCPPTSGQRVALNPPPNQLDLEHDPED